MADVNYIENLTGEQHHQKAQPRNLLLATQRLSNLECTVAVRSTYHSLKETNTANLLKIIRFYLKTIFSVVQNTQILMRFNLTLWST
jgi:hypothetical protein